MEEQEIYGKLFEKIPLYNEGHLDVLLQTLNDESSKMMLISAVTYAYQRGIFSLAECEVISKSIRTIQKKKDGIEPSSEN